MGSYPGDCLLNPQLSCLLKWSSIIINHHENPEAEQIQPIPKLFFYTGRLGGFTSDIVGFRKSEVMKRFKRG